MFKIHDFQLFLKKIKDKTNEKKNNNTINKGF